MPLKGRTLPYARFGLRLLARGGKEIAAGKGHGLDAVLAEADALQAEGDR